MTEKQREIIIKSLTWFISLFIIIFIGVNNVFADEVIDTSTWIGVTGRQWSLSPQEYYIGQQTFDNNWLKNKYNVSSGIYTPPSDFDYITFSFFQHQGGYNPCNSGDYRTSFNLKFSTSNYVNYVKTVRFADSNCSIVSDSNTGIITVNCPVKYLSQNHTYIAVDFNEISGNSSSDLYISRYINTSCDINTGAIIDSNNQNTQNIINNNNTNTENIINNQNQNTQQQIESQKVCSIIDKDDIVIDNKYLNSSNGNLIDSSTRGITDYIYIYNSEINLIILNSDNMGQCFYNNNKDLISCLTTSSLELGQINIPNNAYYVRFSIRKNTNSPQFEICKNGNQAISDDNKEAEKTRKGILGKIKDLFDTLFSNDDADISGLDNMVGWLPAGPVDSIINLPLSLFNALTNTLSGTCTPVTLTLPFVNQNLTLPCFDAYMSQYVSGFNTLWTWVGVTVSVFILYGYLLNLYKWIDDTLTMRENNLPGYYDDNMWGGA